MSVEPVLDEPFFLVEQVEDVISVLKLSTTYVFHGGSKDDDFVELAQFVEEGEATRTDEERTA